MYLLILSFVLRLVRAASTDDAECMDTPDWTFLHGTESYTCTNFAASNVCGDRECKQTGWGQFCGDYFNNPERNCCVCGKQAVQPETVQQQLELPASSALERIKAEIEEGDTIDATSIDYVLKSLSEEAQLQLDEVTMMGLPLRSSGHIIQAPADSSPSKAHMIDKVLEASKTEVKGVVEGVIDRESTEDPFTDDETPGSKLLSFLLGTFFIAFSVLFCYCYGLWSSICYPIVKSEGYRVIPNESRNGFYDPDLCAA